MKCLLVFLVLVSSAHAAGPCDRSLGGLTSLEINRAVNEPSDRSKARMLSFTTRGLIELRRMASENDLTIYDILTDVIAATQLMLESYGLLMDRGDQAQVRLGMKLLKDLDGLVGRTKFKAVHHERLNAVMYTLETIALDVARAQISRDRISSFDPFGPIDEHFITNLINAAEDGMLDQALSEVDERRRGRERALEVSARARLLRSAPPEAGDAPTSDTDAFDDVLAQSPAPIETPVPVGDEVEHETNLAAVLKKDQPLRTDVRYRAQTSRGLALELTISPHLMKQHDEGERSVVRRLLRGVLVGRRHAGVKMLPELGDGVIEVKAIMHGHKRILGCLEGRTVRLLRMIDIKADRGTYSRRIPRDLCAPTPR